METRLPITLTAILTACGAATTSANNSSNDMAVFTDSDQNQVRGNQAQPTDDSLKSFAALQDAVESGGIPGCFDPALSGRERAVAERLGGVPCDRSGGSGASGDSWAGRYEGRFDGGNGIVSISPPTSAGYHQVEVQVAGGGCSGSATVSERPNGNRMVLSIPVDGNQGLCLIDLNRRGSIIAVSENNCMELHGMSCGFSGNVTRRGQSAAAPQQSVPVRSASWIVGAWVTRGEHCGGHGITFNANGTYGTAEDSGTWTLAGNTLTSVSRVVFEMGDMESERAVPNPRPVRATVLSRNASSFTLRGPDGSVATMVRCR
jgi:hypothetical protein